MYPDSPRPLAVRMLPKESADKGEDHSKGTARAKVRYSAKAKCAGRSTLSCLPSSSKSPLNLLVKSSTSSDVKQAARLCTTRPPGMSPTREKPSVSGSPCDPRNKYEPP